MRCFLPRRCGFPRAGLKIRAFKTAGYSTASRALNRALRVWGKVFLRDWHVGDSDRGARGCRVGVVRL